MKYISLGLITCGLMMVSTIAVEARPLTTKVSTPGVSIRTNANGNIKLRSGNVQINQSGGTVTVQSAGVPCDSDLSLQNRYSGKEDDVFFADEYIDNYSDDDLKSFGTSRLIDRNYLPNLSIRQYSGRTGNYIYQYSKVKGNGRTIIQNSSSVIRR